MFGTLKRLLIQGGTKINEQAAKANPNDFDALMGYGAGLGKQRRYEEAAKVFERAVLLRPDSGDAFLCLGSTYGFLDRPEDKIRMCENAVRLQPTGVAYGNLSTAYGKVERYQDAAIAAKKAIELAPELSEAHFALGLAYTLLGDIKNALTCWNKLRQLDPKLAQLLEKLISTGGYRESFSTVEALDAEQEGVLENAGFSGEPQQGKVGKIQRQPKVAACIRAIEVDLLKYSLPTDEEEQVAAICAGLLQMALGEERLVIRLIKLEWEHSSNAVDAVHRAKYRWENDHNRYA